MICYLSIGDRKASKQQGPSGKSTTVLRFFPLFFWSSSATIASRPEKKKGVNNRIFLIWVGIAFPAAKVLQILTEPKKHKQF
jgi:hypothetical protein